jgi:hypothetical protein
MKIRSQKSKLSADGIKIVLTGFIMFLSSIVQGYGNILSDKNSSMLTNPIDSVRGRVYEHASLKGHKFIINSNIGSPFIETFIENRIGAGQTIDLDIPTIRLSGNEVVQLKGELVFTALQFEYQQKIKDWMAFNATIVVSGRLGNKAGSLISEGVNVFTGYQFGWLFKLYKNKEMMLSGTLDVTNNSVTLVDLNKFVQGIIDSGKITKNNQLVTDIPALRAGGGLRGSYAFNQTFGFTGFVNLKNGESADRDNSNRWFFNFGLAFDADLMPKQKVPIGFLLGFYSLDFAGAKETLENDPKNIILQINYTGKDDLNLGLEFNYQTYKPVNYDRNISFANVTLGLKYFF